MCPICVHFVSISWYLVQMSRFHELGSSGGIQMCPFWDHFGTHSVQVLNMSRSPCVQVFPMIPHSMSVWCYYTTLRPSLLGPLLGSLLGHPMGVPYIYIRARVDRFRPGFHVHVTPFFISGSWGVHILGKWPKYPQKKYTYGIWDICQ